MTVGEKIKEKRKALKLTQKELSKRANISETALINYEKNKRTPSLEILEKIASALGINLFSLLCDKYIDKKDTEIEYHAFIDYLNSLGYTVIKISNQNKNISKADNKNYLSTSKQYAIEIIKDNKSVILGEKEFTELQNDTKEVITFKLWQKLNHNQGN